MEKEIELTVDQHYVPRCYLRNFALPVGKPKKNKYLIGFFQFSNNLLKESVCPIESICNKDFFYDTDNKIEHMLSDKESTWAWVLKLAIEKSKNEEELLGVNEEFTLKQFAIYQYFRTPSNLNYSVLQMAETYYNVILGEHGEYLTSNNEKISMWNLCISRAKELITPAWFVQKCDELLKLIDDLRVSLIRNTTKKKFIFSDAPIVVLNPYTINHCGLEMVGIIIVYPIDEDTAVIIYDDKMYGKMSKVIEIVSEDDMAALNAYQYITAEDFLFSKDKPLLEKIKNSEKLINARNSFAAKNKVSLTMSDMGSSSQPHILAIHGRNLDYIYKFSFIRLPKKIAKISEDCRDSLPRQYEKEWRYRLLQETYGMDDIRKQQGFPIDEVIRQRESFKKLLTYMDDYWKVPLKERTITPQMLKSIKANKGEFFRIANQNDDVL